ncbi:formin-binding protein HOF1 [Aspergillus foveolatus]|uniref:formin-binding protein HOF1 n=1 Tax=Aspergillus foveolatus TaxID=210207 RepID=UPI003CCD33B0
MPGTVSEGPTVALSFANNFWGKDDAGVAPMLERMQAAKLSCDELKTWYNIRAAIEDEYARKLLTLCRKPLGAHETGSLRESFDTVRAETEAIAKAHAAIAGQMKRELEEPLIAFAGGNKERRKIIQNGIERIHKTKMQQTHTVNKTRDRYEQDCLRIKGYLAQGHMVMGQEERKNKAKLEKTQIQLASSSSEYDAAVKVLADTTERWNKEWKAACDKFQDLEEERIDFTKSSLWTYANIASTVCVSDDASCERIRLSLENCEVEKDIIHFIKERGTGQEIPAAPRFINFSRGDVNDASSDVSEEEGYSVAQFQRTINPAFRSSSPQPSTYESHHEAPPAPVDLAQNGPSTPSSREPAVPLQKPTQPPMQPPTQAPMQSPIQQQPPPLDFRRGGHLPPNYDPNQHGEISAVPHNAYPTDGMTMFCRTGPPSERSSGTTSGYRPSSQDSHSEVSNATSISSQESPSARQSPTKPTNGVALPGIGSGEVQPAQKKKFFSNSPFRRKSRHDKDRNSGPSQLPTRRTWDSPSKQTTPIKAPTPQKPQQHQPPITKVADDIARSASPEPVDPRANFQLNVGNNVFDVASPDKPKPTNGAEPVNDGEDTDPIARALADLKVAGKQSATRVSADRYHGIATPVPSAPASNFTANSVATPPPAYNDASVKRLDAPQPAFTSKQMQKTTQQYTGKTHNMLRGKANPVSVSSRSPRQSQEAPRAPSPAAPRRSVSPQPQPQQQPATRGESRMSQYSRAASPNPSQYQSSSVKSRHSQSPSVSTPPQRPSDSPYSPHDFAKRSSASAAPSPTTTTAPRAPSPKEFAKRSSQNSASRAASPQPQFKQQASVPRAVTPQPQYRQQASGPRAVSPQQQYRQQASAPRAVSPQPQYRQQASAPRAVSPQPQYRQQTSIPRAVSPNDFAKRPSQNSMPRAVSPQPQFRQQARPSSAGGMELQLSQPDMYGTSGDGYASPQRESRRPMSYYDGGSQRSRSRSRSMAVADPGRQFSRDGRPILHFARALYSYTAAIPEELGFQKGDVLSVIRLQDDGWWEAEVTTTRLRTGLVPSNYLQII